MKRILIATAFTLLGTGITHAQTEVEPYAPGLTAEGLTYTLPQTSFRVTVTAEKTVTTPGDLHEYAFRYLRLKDVPSVSNTQWKVKSVTLEPYGVPDPRKLYSIKFKSADKTSAHLARLTRDGILLAVNTDQAEEPALSPLPEGTPAIAPLDANKYLNMEILSAETTTKKAELCAQLIYELRESRNALIKGEAENTPKDGQQLKLMLDQLDLQANAISQLFEGYQGTSTHVFSFTYTPASATGQDILFRISPTTGIVDADDLAGSPVYVRLRNTESLPAPVPAPVAAGKKKEKPETGLYYNVPARVDISVFDNTQEYYHQEVPMGQFGNVEILSHILFDKKTTTRVTFNPTTGGIKAIEK